MKEYKYIYTLIDMSNESKLIGPANTNVSVIEELIGSEILIKEGNVKAESDEYQEQLVKLFSFLEKILMININIGPRDIVNIWDSITNGEEEKLLKLYLSKETIITLYNGKPIYPKTINQKYYIDSLDSNDITFSIGPAGTGKTYLAVLYAVSLLKKSQIKKIVLVRPVVESCLRLGFLPGDLKEKVDPYLIPLYDTLNDALGTDGTKKLMDKGIIEVAPLAYMRGRTLDNAVVILDEAQNTSKMQMKMFLTRLGFNSKMIITGDVTQIDLQNKNDSGLIEAMNILNNVKGIKIIHFKKNDVMRHPLVYKIIKCYEDNNGI